MDGQNKQPDGVGGLWGVGPGLVGYSGWIIAFAMVLLLAWLAWWTMRPAKRAARSKGTADVREPDLGKRSDGHGDDLRKAKRARKTR